MSRRNGGERQWEIEGAPILRISNLLAAGHPAPATVGTMLINSNYDFNRDPLSRSRIALTSEQANSHDSNRI